MTKRSSIVLIGMAGCGKSTVGRTLAQRTGRTLVDTDQQIVEAEGRSIPDIFGKEGEAYFRAVESRVIGEILAGDRLVVSTGGGAVLAEANREQMRQRGFVVHLAARAETIIARVRGDLNRPLLKGNPETEVPLLLERRRHAYDFADLRIDTDGRSPDHIADEILRAFERYHPT